MNDHMNKSAEHKVVREAIREFFDDNVKEKRFVDMQRIPFICDDIKQMKEDIKMLTRYVFIGVGILTAINLAAKFIR